MNFASSHVFCDLHHETEPIYADELTDGIAHAAKEQAEAWQQAADEDGVDSAFVRELILLTSQEMDKKRAGVARAGELGTKSRLQPRMKSGAMTIKTVSIGSTNASVSSDAFSTFHSPNAVGM